MSLNKGLVTYVPQEFRPVFPKSKPSGVVSKEMVPLFQKAVEVLIEHPQTVFFVSGFPRNDQENPDPSGDVFFPARIGGYTPNDGFIPACANQTSGVIRGSRLRINAGADGYLLGVS